MMFSVLALGFFIGLQHSLEADHVAAVASAVARQRSSTSIIRHGAMWGIGHAMTLLCVIVGTQLLGTEVDPSLTSFLEILVGVMLFVLGAGVILRLYRDRVHFHVHEHAGGVRHFHAHSHRRAGQHEGTTSHDHDHSGHDSLKMLFIGTMHGLAGSAALIVFAATRLDGFLAALAYGLVFGVGSITGMVCLSCVLALPISYAANAMTRMSRALQGCIGILSMSIAVHLIYSMAVITLVGRH